MPATAGAAETAVAMTPLDNAWATANPADPARISLRRRLGLSSGSCSLARQRRACKLSCISTRQLSVSSEARLALLYLQIELWGIFGQKVENICLVAGFHAFSPEIYT